MEQYVATVRGTEWTYIGGDADAKKPYELVVRAFDGDALCATGDDPSAPDAEAVEVPRGEGRRLEGKHFFARPAKDGGSVLISHRGLHE